MNASTAIPAPMKIRFATLLASLLALFGASSALRASHPAFSAFAVLYTGENYTGWSYHVLPGDQIDDFERLQDGRWSFLDREIKSIEIHGEMFLRLFERTEFRGDSVLLAQSIPDLRHYQPPYAAPGQGVHGDDGDWRDRVASLTAEAGPIPSSALPVDRHYGGHRVVFFEHAGFGGSSLGFDGPTEVRRLGRVDIGERDWNDLFSSVRIAGPFSVTLYKNGNLSGPSITLTESTENLSAVINAQGRPESWNDSVSSFRIERLPPPGHPPPVFPSVPPETAPPMPDYTPTPAAATVYGKPGFQGASLSLLPGQDYARLGQFRWSDRITSIEVEEGYVIILYADGNFQGPSLRVTGSVSNLKDQGWADRASSLRVERAE